MSTPDDEDSLDFLVNLGMKHLKVGSGEANNLPYLRKIGQLNQNLIVSTGMCEMEEVHDLVNSLVAAGTEKEKITVLHCNTDYPSSFSDVNLKAMKTIGDVLGVNYGYSDHTLGFEVPIAAVALGAQVIEKHFTIDKNMDGPDHKASLDPSELKHMVRFIRNI